MEPFNNIAVLNIHTADFKNNLLQKLSEMNASSSTHFIVNQEVYESQLKALDDKLSKYPELRNIYTDYTVNKEYINSDNLFGKSEVINEYLIKPNMHSSFVFHIASTINILNMPVQINNVLELSLTSLLMTKTTAVDSHVVFNFEEEEKITKGFFSQDSLKKYIDINSNKMHYQLKRLSVYHQVKFPFSNDHDTHSAIHDKYINTNIVMADKLMKVPVLNKIIEKQYKYFYRYFYNRKIRPYHHMKNRKKVNAQQVELQRHIVFLGFDYGYRGNSKYLFEYMMKKKSCNHFKIKFITDEMSGEHFISPKDIPDHLIENAAVVIAESFQPDQMKINGYFINLWHGIPIKQLFLDSSEPAQNENIFLYRLRKYRKLQRTDLFLTDSPLTDHYFKSAFNLDESVIQSYGYPRVQYLQKNNHETFISALKTKYNIPMDKTILFYCPTWKDYDYPPPDLSLLKDNYYVIFKPHPEAKRKMIGQDVSHIPTEDALLMSDIILSDYSSVIFDAFNINRKVVLLMDDFDEYTTTRGVYEDIVNSLKQCIYHSCDELLNDLNKNNFRHLNSHAFAHDHQSSCEMLTQHINNVLKQKNIHNDN